MSGERHPNETVTNCPRCGGRGHHLKPMLPPSTVVSTDDYMKCAMCEGSGRVFVVPARVIGPAPLPHQCSSVTCDHESHLR